MKCYRYLPVGIKTEGSRYGPKREDDEYAGEFAPDFFSNPAQLIHDPVSYLSY